METKGSAEEKYSYFSFKIKVTSNKEGLEPLEPVLSYTPLERQIKAKRTNENEGVEFNLSDWYGTEGDDEVRIMIDFDTEDRNKIHISCTTINRAIVGNFTNNDNIR